MAVLNTPFGRCLGTCNKTSIIFLLSLWKFQIYEWNGCKGLFDTIRGTTDYYIQHGWTRMVLCYIFTYSTFFVWNSAA